MKPVFEVVPAEESHVREIVRRLRKDHTGALSTVGYCRKSTRTELLSVFHASSFRRAWMINGKLSGLGGVTGDFVSDTGYIWLALSEDAMKYPVQIIREARKQLTEIMATRTEIATTVLGSDDAALRFAAFLGFHVDHQPRDRQSLVSLLKTDPAKHIPIGGGFVVAMGYHQEAA